MCDLFWLAGAGVAALALGIGLSVSDAVRTGQPSGIGLRLQAAGTAVVAGASAIWMLLQAIGESGSTFALIPAIVLGVPVSCSVGSPCESRFAANSGLS